MTGHAPQVTAPDNCPLCPADNLGAYAERHAAEHRRLARRYAEAVAADAAVTAAYGPVRSAK